MLPDGRIDLHHSLAKLDAQLGKLKSETEKLLFEFIKAPRVRAAIQAEAKERMKKTLKNPE